MKTTPPNFHENVCVSSNKDSNEYLAISLCPIDHTDEYDKKRLWEVHVYRYCVPGRCDTYSFYWNQRNNGPERLEYFSDGWKNILESAKMAKKDFDRPQVAEMFKRALSDERTCLYFRRDVMSLLQVIAPNTKTIKALKRTICRTIKLRAERLVVEGRITRDAADRVIQSI